MIEELWSKRWKAATKINRKVADDMARLLETP